MLSANFSTFSTLNTFVLSANFSNLLDMSSSKSFIYYIKNSIGPNTDPCGKKVIPQALRHYEGLYGQCLNPVSVVRSNLECSYTDSPRRDTSPLQIPSKQCLYSFAAE